MTSMAQNVPTTEQGNNSFTLPCGYIDPSGNLHNVIKLRELSGVEDDILDSSELSINQRISQVITACTEKLGTVTDKKVIEAAISDNLAGISNTGLPLTAQDRIAALLFLRRVSIGDVYKFERRCPKCGEMNKNKQLDLRSLTITPVKDPKKRKVQVTLPRSNKMAVLKVLAAKGEEAVSDLKPTQKDIKSYAILARLESLDGKFVDSSNESALNEALDLVKKLPQADRAYLIQVYQMIEGNVDTDIQVKCKNAMCGIEFEFPLDLGALFYSSQVNKPTEAELTWL
jgi:hypothetical protein